MYQASDKALRVIVLALLLAAGPALTGCDGSDDPVGGNNGESQSVDGRVTDDQGYEKASNSVVDASRQGAAQAASVEGAAVTATSVTAEGSGEALNVSGQTETNAEGRYSIDVEDATEYIVVEARKGAQFSSRVLVQTRTEATDAVQAMPMTAESEGEAKVYVEARSQDEEEDEGHVTSGDVALYVNSKVGSDIENGESSASEVAGAIRSGAEAEAEAFAESGENPDEEQAQQNEEDAFLQLQSALSASGNTTTELENFQEQMAEAYADADVSAEGQVQARQAGAAAVRLEFSGSSNAELGLRQGAEMMASSASEAAIQAALDGTNASSSTIETAGNGLRVAIRNANRVEDIDEAKATFRSEVESELASQLNISAAALDAANSALASLVTDVLVLGREGGMGSAYAEFFSQAEAQAQSSLTAQGVSEANAQAAAKVLVVLQGMGSTGGNTP